MQDSNVKLVFKTGSETNIIAISNKGNYYMGKFDPKSKGGSFEFKK